jgi:hypothetical protein
MRQILLSALKIVISGALLYLALRKVDLHDLASRITRLGSVSWIVLAILGAFGGLVWILSPEKAAKGTAPIRVEEAC